MFKQQPTDGESFLTPPVMASLYHLAFKRKRFADEKAVFRIGKKLPNNSPSHTLAISFITIAAHAGAVIFGASKKDFVAWKPNQASIIPAMLVFCTLLLGLTLKTDTWTMLSR